MKNKELAEKLNELSYGDLREFISMVEKNTGLCDDIIGSQLDLFTRDKNYINSMKEIASIKGKEIFKSKPTSKKVEFFTTSEGNEIAYSFAKAAEDAIKGVGVGHIKNRAVIRNENGVTVKVTAELITK